MPRSDNEEYLVFPALKHWLFDNAVVKKQQICPALLNGTLQKLTKINPFYSNITTDNEWEDFSEQSDSVLWNILTDRNADKNT